MKHITNVFVLLFLSWAMLSVIPACRSDKTEQEPIPEDTVEHLYLLDICIDTLDVEDCVLKPGENLSVVLTKLGISAGKIDSLSKCCEGVFDITKMKAGNPYTLLRHFIGQYPVLYLSGKAYALYRFRFAEPFAGI